MGAPGIVVGVSVDGKEVWSEGGLRRVLFIALFCGSRRMKS